MSAPRFVDEMVVTGIVLREGRTPLYSTAPIKKPIASRHHSAPTVPMAQPKAFVAVEDEGVRRATDPTRGAHCASCVTGRAEAAG
jgi:hypothetical protein